MKRHNRFGAAAAERLIPWWAIWLVGQLVACGTSGSDPALDAGAAVPVDGSIASSKEVEAKTEQPHPGISGRVPVNVPTFEKLDLTSKKLALSLYYAAWAGEPIHFRTTHPESFRVNRLFEAISTVHREIPGQIYPKIKKYAEQFWLNQGNRDLWTNQRLIPTFIPGELAAAAQIAMRKGMDLGTADLASADLGANRLQELEALLGVVRPYLYSASVEEKTKTELADAGPSDPISAADVTPLPFSAFARDSQAVIRHLRNGIEWADAQQKEHLAQQIAFWQTGSSLDYQTLLHQSGQTETKVELFYLAVPTKGAKSNGQEYRAIVALHDKEKTAVLEKVATSWVAYEQAMPWSRRFIREPEQPPKMAPLAVMDALTMVGKQHPVSAMALEMPGLTRIGETIGGRKVLFGNISTAWGIARTESVAMAFSPNRAAMRRRAKWYEQAQFAFWALKELPGRHAGVRNPRTESLAFGYAENTEAILREIRAELIALYHGFTPISAEIGLIPHEDCAKAMLDEYVTRALEQIPVLPDAKQIEENPLLPRHMIVRYLVDKKALQVEELNGHIYLNIPDYTEARKKMGEMLAQVQLILFMGDYKAGNRLVNVYGAAAPAKWRAAVEKRWKTLQISPRLDFFFPLLTPKVDATGQIVDVQLEYFSDIVQYRLKIAGQRDL